MAIYIALCLAMAVVGALCYQFLGRKQGAVCYLIFFSLAWALLLGLRHPSMGSDLNYGTPDGYWMAYQTIGRSSWWKCFHYHYQNYERGYILLNKALYCLSPNPQLLLIFCGAFSLSSVGLWICRSSRHPFLSTVIYLGLPCFLINFSAMRQVVALAVTLWSLRDIREKRWLRFILTVLAAGLFHGSALLFLFAYPVYHLRLTRPWALASTLVPILVWIFRGPVFTVLVRLLRPGVQPDENGAFVLFAVLYLIYLYTVVFADFDSSEENGFRNLFFAAVLLQALGGMHSNVLRVGYYYMIYAALVIPSVVDNHLRSGKSHARAEYALMFMLVCVCFTCQAFSQLASTDWAEAIPYLFCWN